ncbi:hypothetical protein HUK80_15780 [Flavobacterium sp. MAH-1]|uniref:Alpha/beta hydrolase n=1 Tax=Flavobacterium agri TaxID=2743471 RepID=A0A7Y8Y4D0_9FLAO|nr:hypothetical protein [Flavobacterium agri]NUY82365.1 hypothetical protein [Flavobacterium agri]NYA72389.1 hypothetical protein [Flavobacterium agri]
MRSIFFFVLTLACFATSAQNQTKDFLEKDSLIIVAKNPKKGFYYEYILFVPKKTPLHKKSVLLVEPNNTGKVSDDIELHKKYAIDLASVSSVGNNVSTELRIPLLVPIFPRPESDSLMYTHALDRDVMLQKSPELKRLDLQLLHMIDDAKRILIAMDIAVESKIFMNGFSASATFTNRFSFVHPDKIKALAIGGFNGELMLPNKEINGVKLDYPIGTNDFRKLFGKNFDLAAYKTIPQLIYMGKLDDNDAVQYDDAYSEKERAIINDNIGKQVQPRYLACQKIYLENGITPIFKTFENVGHWTTADVNLEVITFFYKQMQEK